MSKKTKFIVITGGVISGIGKGVAAASIGSLFKDEYKVTPIKCDGYLNTDPGTINPIEHGEVFVLDDGGEVDMDFGHYERFLDVSAKSSWSITMGKVYKNILEREREGQYLGKTVQLIPHVSDEIKRNFYEITESENSDLAIVEIGGTVGDMENTLFIEAVRQMRAELGLENIIFIHLTYIPTPAGINEQKSKPTQQSVKILNEAGIVPDIILARSQDVLNENIKSKIAMFCNIPVEAIINNRDLNTIYEMPILFYEQNLHKIIAKKLNIKVSPNITKTKSLVNVIKSNLASPKKIVNIAICGKYTALEDSYASIYESLIHVGANLDLLIKPIMVDTTNIDLEGLNDIFKNIDGVIVPGGFGGRGTEGKIEVIKYARENNIPFLGICLGMQLAIIEFARNVCGLKNAGSEEMQSEGLLVSHPVIHILPEQKDLTYKGASMRLGAQQVNLTSNTKAFEIYNKKSEIKERFRHRYEVNNDYLDLFVKNGLIVSGRSLDNRIVQIIELDKHKFFLGVQFHPELKSHLEKPAPLFYSFIKAIKD